jgi:hypothetical protein
MSREKAGQKHSIKIANRSFEGVAKFKYLGTTLTDQNCMQEEITSKQNSGNACYHSVQSLLSSRLLSRNVKVKIYKAIILPVVLYGCETWSLTLREEHRRKVFENRVLRRIFGPKRDEVTGEWIKLHNEELHILYSSPNIIRQIKSRRMRWVGHVARMGEEGTAVVFNRGYAKTSYVLCITCIMYQQFWGYKVEEKLYLGVREQKRFNITGVQGFDGKAIRKETTWKTKA